MPTQEPTRDHATERYFDEHVPEYSPERLAFAARTIGEVAGPRPSLVDLGSGAGNTLAFLQQQVELGDCLAVDVSPRLLERAAELAGCPTLKGSLMDPALPQQIGRKFDVAVIAAVLHHLIGSTRADSRRLAGQAVELALDVLEPGGHLVILEPIYYPRVVMDGLFYVKKAFSSVTTERVSIGGYWNNLGAPVVSYYTNEELVELATAGGRAEVVARDIDPEPLGRLNALLSKTNTTIVVRKTAG
ncbi:MAG TPA: class I SAM-dependent methyltransferase [Solirubrobacteraceae bacterium]|nr:class I SAM-dependent methyltransferase [Solirubrobacteraceae bacterium]